MLTLFKFLSLLPYRSVIPKYVFFKIPIFISTLNLAQALHYIE
jgi:hypothetical protein